MKKLFNKKIIGLCGLILAVAIAFLANSYANKATGYEIRIGLKLNQGQEKSMVFPSERQVAYWKIEDKKMGPWDIMRLAKDCDGMSLGEISKKLGKEAEYSDKSKLFFDGKEYDKMTSAMYERNKGAVKEIIKIKNLDPGAYLIKETDQAYKKSKGKERLRTRIEYVGKESAPDGVLNLDED